jgi:hypothetical protein
MPAEQGVVSIQFFMLGATYVVRSSHPALECHNSSQHVIQEAVDGGPPVTPHQPTLNKYSMRLPAWPSSVRQRPHVNLNSGPPDTVQYCILYVSNHMREWCERLDIGTSSNGTHTVQYCTVLFPPPAQTYILPPSLHSSKLVYISKIGNLRCFGKSLFAENP